MESTSKVVIWIVVAILVVGGIYYWYSNRAPAPAATGTPQASTQTQGTTANAGPALPSGSDTSDAALNQDSASMNAQVSAMDSDTAAIDQGMNDKQVSQ